MNANNKLIGSNIARWRKWRGLKALDIADRLAMSEAAYTKHERGESNNTSEFIQKVAKELSVDPLVLQAEIPANSFENFTNSPVAINGNSTLHTTPEQLTLMLIKLMESVVTLNENILELLQKGK